MTSFSGIWDAEDYLGQSDQTFDLSQMWLQQVACRFTMDEGRCRARHGKPREAAGEVDTGAGKGADDGRGNADRGAL
jgi:hypothetical protein